MFVGKSMTKKVIFIGKEVGILEAHKKMVQNNIRHLPVVEDDNTLIGIVTDRDIRSGLPYELFKKDDFEKEKEKFSDLKVKDIMSKDPFTISASHTIQDALLLIQEKRVGAFPVVDEQGKLKGILSVRDLLRTFTNVLGIGEPGTLLCLLVDEKIGQLKKIVDAITEEKISCGSVLVARYWEEGKRAVFPYLLTQNVAPVKRKLEKMGYKLLDPMEWYMDQLPKSD
jgi:acetoin utilization protein AcuB